MLLTNSCFHQLSPFWGFHVITTFYTLLKSSPLSASPQIISHSHSGAADNIHIGPHRTFWAVSSECWEPWVLLTTPIFITLFPCSRPSLQKHRCLLPFTLLTFPRDKTAQKYIFDIMDSAHGHLAIWLSTQGKAEHEGREHVRKESCSPSSGWEWLWEKCTTQKCNLSDRHAPASPHPLVSATYQQSLRLLLHPWIIHWLSMSLQSLTSQSPSKELAAEYCCLGHPDFNAWVISGHFKSKANLLLFLILFKDVFLSVCLYILML